MHLNKYLTYLVNSVRIGHVQNFMRSWRRFQRAAICLGECRMQNISSSTAYLSVVFDKHRSGSVKEFIVPTCSRKRSYHVRIKKSLLASHQSLPYLISENCPRLAHVHFDRRVNTSGAPLYKYFQTGRVQCLQANVWDFWETSTTWHRCWWIC